MGTLLLGVLMMVVAVQTFRTADADGTAAAAAAAAVKIPVQMQYGGHQYLRWCACMMHRLVFQIPTNREFTDGLMEDPPRGTARAS